MAKVLIGTIKVPKGDTGPQGPQGIQGPQGPQGETSPLRNNLTATTAGKEALDAVQGRVLDEKITTMKSEIDSNLGKIIIGCENYINNGRCNSIVPTGLDGYKSAARVTAEIIDDYLLLICNNSTDPYYQIMNTGENNLMDGTLNPQINPGDNLTVSFDYECQEGTSASISWFACVNGKWNETIISLSATTVFVRTSHTYTIPKNATGFMMRFRVRTLDAHLKIKNIALVKGSIPAYHFLSVQDIVDNNPSKYPNGLNITDSKWLPSSTRLTVGESAAIIMSGIITQEIIGISRVLVGMLYCTGDGIYYIKAGTGNLSGSELSNVYQYIIRWSVDKGWKFKEQPWT